MAGATAGIGTARAASESIAAADTALPLVWTGAAAAGAGPWAAVAASAAAARAVAPSSTLIIVLPTRISSPNDRAPLFTRLPLTKVPSTLPMSMIDSLPSGATSMTEWMRLTLSSSRQRWAEARRPILMMSRS